MLMTVLTTSLTPAATQPLPNVRCRYIHVTVASHAYFTNSTMALGVVQHLHTSTSPQLNPPRHLVPYEYKY